LRHNGNMATNRPFTIAGINATITEINHYATIGDYDAAASLEYALYIQALECIADGCDEPRARAQLVLKVKGLKFPRHRS